MKKVLFIFLCLLANTIGIAQATTIVESGTYETVNWSFYSDGLLIISGVGDIPDFNKSSEPSPNTNDRPWGKYRNKVRYLLVQDGVTRIGSRAFQSFALLESVELANSVGSIGVWAFQNCYKLEDVIMSDDIVLENGAFRNTPVEEELAAKESDGYTCSLFFQRLCETPLIGNFRTDVISIALSQVGYHEGNSEADYGGDNTSGNGDYTEYGRFMSSSGTAWCSEFASWCIRMSGLPKSVLVSCNGANANTFTSGTPSHYYRWNELVYGGGDYEPQSGDLLLWAWDLDNHEYNEYLSHTSIFRDAVIEGDNVVFHTVEGNSGNRVKEGSFTMKRTDGSLTTRTGRLYYLVAPDYEYEGVEKHRVFFDARGGLVNGNSKTVATGGLYGPLPVPIRDGFQFLGWYTEPANGKRINMYHPVRIQTDQTLFAHWGGDNAAIKTIMTSNELQSRYNLLGMPINHRFKGLVIENGKKRLR